MRQFDADFSSDTATRPTPEMRHAMANAEVGDEQLREDPTVLLLEERVASLLGKEDAVFLPSGTLANIIGIFVHCAAGDEVMLHRLSHPVYAENAGPAVHSRVLLRQLDGPDGTFRGFDIHSAIHAPGIQRPRSRLVVVENTNNRAGGTIWPLNLLDEVTAAARECGLATHLDGARLLNASVASDVRPDRICSGFDSVWLDLSKGLGCPMGAVLAGTATFIEEARWAKHLFGGALRQAGVIAAAGIYALEHHIARLADDHTLARQLAEGLVTLPGIELAQRRVDTNIVHFDIAGTGLDARGFLERLAPNGVRFSSSGGPTTVLRAVTHLDVGPEHVARALAAVTRALEEPSELAR